MVFVFLCLTSLSLTLSGSIHIVENGSILFCFLSECYLIVYMYCIFLFCFLAVWCSMWDLSSLTRGQTCSPAVEAVSLNPRTTREGPVPHLLYSFLCWWTFRLLPCPGYSFWTMVFSRYMLKSGIIVSDDSSVFGF